MKYLVCLLFLSSFLSAEPPIKTPKPDLKMALWPDRPLKTMEEEGYKYSHIIKVTKVESPSLELYKSQTAKASAPAVVIFPGGGYSILAYDLEGTEIATWLNSIGFHAIVVKYTVPGNKRMEALKDAQRSMGIVRSKASEWGINPKQIGVLGFSAGGHLTAHVSTNYQERAYQKVDKSDETSCRPDFSVLVYPAYLFTKEDKYKLPEEIKVDANTPPAFTVQTLDDRRLIDSAFNYTRALKNAKVDAELHLYAKGGHGYGMRPTDKPVSKWAELCTVWLKNLTK